MIRLCHGNTVGSGECHLSMAGLGPPCPSNTGLVLPQSSKGTKRFHHAPEQHSMSNETYCMCRTEVRVIQVSHWREKHGPVVSEHKQWIPLVMIAFQIAACSPDNKWLTPWSHFTSALFSTLPWSQGGWSWCLGSYPASARSESSAPRWSLVCR